MSIGRVILALIIAVLVIWLAGNVGINCSTSLHTCLVTWR